MKFGLCDVASSEGGIVAHAVRAEGLTLRKGDRVTAQIVAQLQALDIADITVAQLEPGDVGEDEAAARLAAALRGAHVRADHAFTGRANLFAECAGVFMPDVAVIDAINALDEAVTVATLPALRAVVEGEMLATVKIIPFAIGEGLLARAMQAAGASALRIAPYAPMRIAAISTLASGLKPGVIDKTVKALAARVAPAGATVVADVRVEHAQAPLAEVLRAQALRADMIVVFGASAITDRRDVIPAAIEAAGGSIEHFGMPVDPGNLLLLGRLDGKPVLGAPGCARSPRENGFDWILQRLLAGLPVTSRDIRALGVGGLLMEIVSRPQPRAGGESRDD